MSFAIDRNSQRSSPYLQGAPSVVSKSDTAGCLVGGYYPRGYIFLTGGTVTVWVQGTNGLTEKRDLLEVPDGFTWMWGGIFGIASTNEAGADTTCDNILAIP